MAAYVVARVRTIRQVEFYRLEAETPEEAAQNALTGELSGTSVLSDTSELVGSVPAQEGHLSWRTGVVRQNGA